MVKHKSAVLGSMFGFARKKQVIAGNTKAMVWAHRRTESTGVPFVMALSDIIPERVEEMAIVSHGTNERYPDDLMSSPNTCNT